MGHPDESETGNDTGAPEVWPVFVACGAVKMAVAVSGMHDSFAEFNKTALRKWNPWTN
jgi:hypothetical protein